VVKGGSVLVALLAVVAVAPAVAAQPGAPGLVVDLREVTVRPGHLRATVALSGPGAAGRPLRAGAFQATLDGRPAPSTAEPLAATGRGITVALAVDSSGSMRSGGNIGLARRAAERFAAELRPGTAVGVLSFATRPKVVQPPTTDRGRVLAALAGLRAEGRTALRDAVVQAAGLLARSPGQRNLVLLSDGQDDGSHASLDAAVRAATRARVAIYTLGLSGPEQDPAALRTLARQTGGRAVTGVRGADLAGLYQHLGRELSTQYVVDVALPAGSGGTVAFGLTVRAGGLTARAGRALLLGRPAPPRAGPALLPAPPLPLLQTGAGRSLAVVLAFAAVLLAGLALATAGGRPARRLRQRLAPYSLRPPPAPRPAGVLGSSELAGTVAELTESLVRRGHLEAALLARLEAAGLHIRVAEAALAWLGAAVAPPLLVLAILRSPALAFLAAAGGTAAPLAVLAVKASRRRARFQEQLPGTLQLLAGALQAGHGLYQAADTVVHEAGEPIAGEFQRVLTEARLGRPFEEALAAMATRMQSLDFQWTVMAIGLQAQVGGNLAEVLGTVAQTIRERSVLKRQVRTLSAEGRLSAVILSALPPLLFVALLAFNPVFIAPLWSTRTGLLLLGGAAGLMVVGVLWMRKLVEIEV
jgi:tight adherence protein B